MASLSKVRNALVVALALAPLAAWANEYTIVAIGTSDDVTPTAINDKGQMAGNAFLGHVIHGMLYRKGNWQKLGPYTWATSVNAAGDVGGQFASGVRAGQGFIWPRKGPPIYMDAGAPAKVAGLNDERVVLGTFLGPPRSFVWTQERGVVDLGSMGRGNVCEAFAINNAGQVTGYATANPDGRTHAFIWHEGQFQDLGRLPGHDDTVGKGINDRGEVVGHAAAKDGAHHAFHWNGAAMIALDPQATYAATEATAINDAGEIVGGASNDPHFIGNAVRFAEGKVISLLTEVESPGDWVLWTAVGINKHGVIVGDGNLGGYMLIPKASGQAAANPP